MALSREYLAGDGTGGAKGATCAAYEPSVLRRGAGRLGKRCAARDAAAYKCIARAARADGIVWNRGPEHSLTFMGYGKGTRLGDPAQIETDGISGNEHTSKFDDAI
jgi:hypothetical protein